MPPRTIALFCAALWLASSPVAAQSHDAPKVVPANAAATPASPHSPIPAATPAAPASAAKPSAAAATPVKLGEVRGRINAALAAMPAPARVSRPRRASALPSEAAPSARYEVRWPEERWHVQWPAAVRLTVSWPQ